MTKIMAAMTAALTLAGCATAVRAPIIEIKVGAARPLPGAMTGTTIDVTATNTGRSAARSIAVSCRFFDAAGATVNTGTTFFSNLAVGASETNGVIVPTAGVARGVCVVRP